MVGIVGFSLAPILCIGNNGIRRGHVFFVIRNCNFRSSSSSTRLSFTTTTAEAATCGTESHFVVDYLIQSHRFSREDAILIASKVINNKSRSDPTLVLDYLKQIGMKAIDIKKTISKFPNILFCDLDKNIRPKIQCLEEIGLSVPDIAKLIVAEPSILRRGLDSHLRPMLRFLVQAVGTKGNAVKAIKRCTLLLSKSSLKNITENLPVLRDMGLLDAKGNKSVWVYSVICVAATTPKSKLDKIIEIFRSFGWHDSEIYTLLQRTAHFTNLSENKLKKVLTFLMNELGYGSHYLATRHQLLTYSLEKRTIPRNEVLKILEENHLTGYSLFSAIKISEANFFQDFVLLYKDMFPDMYERYIMQQRSIPSPSSIWKSKADKKIEILRSFGWSNSEINTLLQKLANFTLSEDRYKKILSFLMKELGFGSNYLATRPLFLKYSLEKRTIPRSEVIKILNENQLTRCSLYTAIKMPESQFFQNYVLRYKDKFPDMYERYIMHQRSIASPPSSTT